MNKDKRIVMGMLHGDEKAFNALVDEYSGLIKSIVRYHLAKYSQYEDECVNDILLSVWQNISSYDESKNSLKNWLGAVSKYKCIDYKRKYYKSFYHEQLDENMPDNKNELESEIEEDIESILCYLNPADRDLFYRHYILGEKIEEISKDSDKSVAFFYNRLSRGRKKLRLHLQRRDCNEKRI